MNFQQSGWRKSPDRPRLKDDEIHVWRARLEKDPSTLQALFETLSCDEKQKAAGFRFRKDREHFIAARGTLRKILGSYLDAAPARLRFSYGRYGKPLLDSGTDNGSIRFNLSHSRQFALFAFAREQEVGIDLEFIDERYALMNVAEMFFSPAEIAVMRMIPANLRAQAFFSVWTGKEAFLKATGKGLSFSPTRITVPVIPEWRENRSVINDLQKARQWSLMTLPFDSDYKAALAAEGAIGTVRFWQTSEN